MNSIPLLLASRFITSQHQQSFTKLTQSLAVVGIALGVAILIIINAIFNGVQEKITYNLQGIHTHIIATSYSNQWDDWENTTNKIAAKKGVVSAIPRMKRYGLVQSYQDIEPVIIYELSAKYWPKWLRGYSHSDEQASQGGDIVSAWVQKDLADRLYLQPGDTFSAITPEQRDGELTPRGLRFETESIFTDPSLDVIRNTIWVKHDDIEGQTDSKSSAINEIAITTTDILTSDTLARELAQEFPGLIFRDWGESAKTFFESLKIQKKMMIIVLSLVTCIASFNLITGLVILVMEKKMEIAVLQTMGATKKLICQVFVIQGLVTASVGALLGMAIGLPIAIHLTALVEWIEKSLKMKLFSEQVFMLDYLPSKVVTEDVIIIVMFVEFLALLAALYPAKQALSIEPAETIRHE